MLSWIFALAMGCTKQEETSSSSCTEGERSVLLITEILYTLPNENGAINGFDLDQYVTESGDEEGCGHEECPGSCEHHPGTILLRQP